MCRAPPPVLEAMPSLVDRALLKLLGRPVSLRAPRWLVAELRLVLGQMTEEMLQTFVDREEALETSGRLEFDDFATAVGGRQGLRHRRPLREVSGQRQGVWRRDCATLPTRSPMCLRRPPRPSFPS